MRLISLWLRLSDAEAGHRRLRIRERHARHDADRMCRDVGCVGNPAPSLIRFLKTIEAAVPAGKFVHAIADNYATHKHPKVREWLVRHPRWTFHFTPTSASWLNAVKRGYQVSDSIH